MATSPTTKSAVKSGAAKDDAVGLNNDYTFTIDDLLGNDPGGAAKVDVTKQFLFGTTQADWDNQAKYLADHGITTTDGITFTINAGATDFQYMVQIGNKGTWSTANVDVTAPPAEPHVGDSLFFENFDDYAVQTNPGSTLEWAITDMTSNWTGSEYTEFGASGYIGVNTTTGNTGSIPKTRPAQSTSPTTSTI